MHPFPGFDASPSLISAILLASTCLAGVVASPLSPAVADLSSRPPPSSTPPPLAPPKPTNNTRGSRIPLADEVPRLAIYFQTTHNWTNSNKNVGEPISMLPLISQQRIALTHLIVCSFHVRPGGTILLNDFPPDHPLFYTLWNETEVMKTAGVKVMGMVGGAARGSFSKETLDAPPDSYLFERSYGVLSSTIRQYKLDGLDIDVEEDMSQYGISRLIRRLRLDFGRGFIITLSPVASALSKPMAGSRNLSGFDYFTLENSDGGDIDFYMAQFYNGWGSMANPEGYMELIDNSGWDPRKIVAGQVTTYQNGWGFVPFEMLRDTVVALRRKYGQIGGIMGWEYFNGEPGGQTEPWRWAQEMTRILRPELWRDLRVTREMAEVLVRAWRDSVVGSRGVFISSSVGGEVGKGDGGIDEDLLKPKVDYMAMINT